jgi:hypothetical protein
VWSILISSWTINNQLIDLINIISFFSFFLKEPHWLAHHQFFLEHCALPPIETSLLPTCWLAQIDEQLSTYNLCINNDQLSPSVRFKQLAERQYIVLHQVATADSNRVRAYLGLNSSAQYGYKEYLSRVDNAQLRRSLARFRCANHKLQIELGRQVKLVKVPVQQRYCKLCDLGAVEDEDHFLLVCPTYQSVRERFRGSLPLTAITPMAELLSCQQQGILARFLVQCQTVRSELLHQT